MSKQFTIQQISQITGLTAHTLRYYEKIGLLDGVARNESGYRKYRESDLLWIDFLIRLRETRMPISEMKQFSDLRSQGKATIKERRTLLERHQNKVTKQIADLEENLLKIEHKIAHYKALEEEDI
ncbi:MerR family transcriptional regulator [Brevibacillus centrosporus]|uniref:DNA-binding transcriptional regulator, MerR family n=1 Tax=Brevibacillus centrosporus TaxID=54910 RepID=A0A1I3QNQ7_9BACL|nr:MerR family transcriptional regulator [Brevibacillus centrosporus]MED4908873.1 MerR family transcriptional regulator [Brevibacillus centrosporus]SFJ34757.1 DNA-binding transcriptional regulator, MerR family [Brevibacillus centrosporus]